MASRRKLPESIALLSMYNDDEEEDEKMEDLDERPPEGEDNRMELESANDLSSAGGDGFSQDGSEAATKKAGRDRVGIIDESETVRVYVDPFDSFLPLQTKEKCPEELQEQFLKLERDGRRINTEIRNGKDYRNPDFLIRCLDIDHIGSCFSKQVFDPHGYDKSDYYDEIELVMELFSKSPRFDFVSGRTRPRLKFTAPVPGFSGFKAMKPTAARDGRQSKKAKWDTTKHKGKLNFRKIIRKKFQSQFRPPPP